MKKFVIILLVVVGLISCGWLFFWLMSDQATAPDNSNGPKAQDVNAPLVKTVKLYFIKINPDGTGLVGCGDDLVAVDRLVRTSENSKLKIAMEQLLAGHDETYSGTKFRNALWQSQLKLDSAKVEGDKAVVAISGQLSLGGECDNPRVEAQLENTAKTAADVTEVEITINGQPLSQALSLQ